MKVLLMAVGLAAVTLSQSRGPIASLSPEDIKAAITFGETAKANSLPGFYQIEGGRRGGLEGFLEPKDVLATYSTPFSRVAGAAYDAKRAYRPFTAESLDPAILVPELWVYAFSRTKGQQPSTLRIVNVEAVVITPHRNNDRAKAIQPIRTQDLDATYRNLFGASLDGKGILGVFPLSALNADNDLHVVFDDRIAFGPRGCEDCAVQFDLKTVR